MTPRQRYILIMLVLGLAFLRTDPAASAPRAAGRTVRVNVSFNATVHVYPEAGATHTGISWRCGSGKWHAVPDGGFRPQCRSRVTITSKSAWFDYEIVLPGPVAHHRLTA